MREECEVRPRTSATASPGQTIPRTPGGVRRGRARCVARASRNRPASRRQRARPGIPCRHDAVHPQRRIDEARHNTVCLAAVAHRRFDCDCGRGPSHAGRIGLIDHLAKSTSELSLEASEDLVADPRAAARASFRRVLHSLAYWIPPVVSEPAMTPMKPTSAVSIGPQPRRQIGGLCPLSRSVRPNVRPGCNAREVAYSRAVRGNVDFLGARSREIVEQELNRASSLDTKAAGVIAPRLGVEVERAARSRRRAAAVVERSAGCPGADKALTTPSAGAGFQARKELVVLLAGRRR
jgi:hypothetical protein